MDPERGHGLGPAGARTPAVPDPLDARGHPRAGRPAGRAGLSHGPLGGRAPHAGGRRGAPRPRVPPVRRLRHRPLRRPDPGDGRDDGQPPLPERRRAGVPPAHPLAAHAAGRPRRRHLRQGPAGDDDGPRGDAESAVRPGAGRRDPARPRRGGRRQGAVHRRALRARRDHPRARRGPGLPRLRLGRRRLPVPGHRRDLPGRGRSARPRPAPLGPGAVGPADLARHGAALRPRAGRARDARPRDPRHPHRRGRAERHDRPRRLRRVHQPASSPPGDRPRRGPPAPDRGRLDRGQSAGPADRRRPAQRPALPPDGAGLHGRRRARGDAPPPAAGPPRAERPHGVGRAARPDARLVGALRPPPGTPGAAARAGRRGSRRRDHVARAGAGPRAHQHGHVPAREPRARGLRDQEHRDRSHGGRPRRRLPEDGSGARVHDRARGDRGHQEHGARPGEGRATSWS